MTIPLPDPTVGGRAAQSLLGMSDVQRVVELERRLESIQRNFDKLAAVFPIGSELLKDDAVTEAKLDSPSRQELLARPVTVLQGSAFQINLTSVSGSYYLSSAKGEAPLLVSADTQSAPKAIYLDTTEWDVVPGYKPQFRIRGSHHSQTTDPGTQTFTCGLTSVVQTTGAGANNARWTVSGTYSSFATTNMAANAASVLAGSWADFATGLYGVYHHASVNVAANAVLSTLWQIDVRWVPE